MIVRDRMTDGSEQVSAAIPFRVVVDGVMPGQ
jgi:hypothetical protein